MARAMKSLGEQLKLARKSKSKSLEDISRDTNISRQYLEALEEDNYDVLPSSAYARGFLSNYARCVDLDPKAVVKQYNKLATLSELLESRTSGDTAQNTEPRRRKHRVIRKRVVALLAAFVLMLLCLVILLQLRGT